MLPNPPPPPPPPPYIIRAFGADSTLLSPATLVLNVQLQKPSYLDKMNDDTEKQCKVYIILDENRSLNTKETIQNKTKAAVKRATKNVRQKSKADFSVGNILSFNQYFGKHGLPSSGSYIY